ncbi:thiamine phosphate synthase [Alkaliphilus metalliredigens]|uniref:thiamine phosphate synthase n=1 Tax=Alkaliphilus metalliredigens TaxID=208226 RepID=UPI00005CD3C2|nr:thiamine phosphate synthase [Alkaliphilus metalliredigens]
MGVNKQKNNEKCSNLNIYSSFVLNLCSEVRLQLLQKIKSSVSIPIVGIGGISQGNASQVIQSGADGIAVVSAILSKQYPEIAAKNLYLKTQNK